ncbi:Dihydrolipoamide acetyltransferase component of pyruvate dehydrogenase complex [Mycena sanguinolenta]|uniref:Dihydrolipoamide acetyltransferase component of pyruvate dehydrogenase complex n=1 Tax=Mycena sanguinolenta TaxID=230812 RepID=A0A8H6Z9S6_9AGAR|nr:Dihydrolipoamide acetyltransferase component of pyruvate dehydrogenase complex [Mycena sanguinolenta]
MFLRPLRPSRALYLWRLQTRWASSKTKVLRTFKLADIGEGITECEVIRWSVSPPAPIGAFDPLCEVQSDKASVEITSPFDGVVKELLVKEGEVAKVGAGLCTIEVEEEAREEPAEEVGTEQQQPKEETLLQSVPEPAPVPPPTPTPRRPHPLDPSFSPSSLASNSNSNDVLATPSVRHFARTQGVDLALLAPGRGKGGRVEKADVEAYLAAGASSSTYGSAPTLTQFEEDTIVELGRTRVAMWRAMVKSLEIPTFGYSTTLDITDLHYLLPALNAHIPAHYRSSPNPDTAWNPAHALGAPPVPDVPDTGRYTRLTYLPFLLKTLARAMMEWPLFRAAITPPSASASASGAATTAQGPQPKQTLTIRPHADIALALATPSGLYTPLLRAADTQSVYSLASTVAHLAALGRGVSSSPAPSSTGTQGSGKQASAASALAPYLGQAGTLTVSNVGAAGRGDGAVPVLIPGGGVAIVALGRANWVWDVSDEFWCPSKSPLGDTSSEQGADTGMRGARRLKLPVSWSADHRVVEGAEMAAFVECWRGWVEQPGRLIGVAV